MENTIALQTGEKNSFIICRNSQGVEIRATPLRLTRYLVVFEVYNPYSILQLSEVLHEFKIIMNERMVYSGRAVVSNLVNTGIVLVCEATLDDNWLDVDLFSPMTHPARLQEEFNEFLKEWEKIYKVLPDFKVIVADMQTLLADLRRWLEQVELGVRSQSTGSRPQMERDVIGELRTPMLPTVNSLFARFEQAAAVIQQELQPVHRMYVKRQLHPLLLCSPFMYRIYQKPLGYAGDYEMVNMILRDPVEGSSLFAKLLNVYILLQAPAEGHRNRVVYLTDKLVEETRRCTRLGRTSRILNLGCGPAKEIQNFLMHEDLCDRSNLTLLDFNDETLEHTGKLLEEIKMKNRRTTQIQMVKKSVHQMLKEYSKVQANGGDYDFIYCAGLFDYLNDRICKRLMGIFYDLLAPGGLLVATNVDASNPIRNTMEYIFEWHLVYRNSRQFETLRPDQAPPDSYTVRAETTGSNIFIEVRKPLNSSN
ncbi:MAG: SAM-dependent methyltransferase [Verrucomicrobiales bacterium]|nr:SAM-dependent methyltransferase [Verrucomicrobiales bacterium]